MTIYFLMMKGILMKNNKKRNVSITTYILSLFIVLIVGIIGTYFVSSRFLRPIQIDQSSFTEQSEEVSLDTIDELYQILTQEYYGEVDEEELVQGALEGMADSVDDPHTEYLDQVESSDMNEQISGSFEGIGAEVVKEEDKIRVVSPIPESPADKAGILPNDYILEVDGESVVELNVQEAVQLIRGEKGTEVNLLIERNGNQLELAVERDSIPIESVVYEQLETEPTVGHVQITRFNKPTYDELVTAIQSLEEDGVDKFIFDVRGNPGGLLDSALQMSNIFVEEGEPLMQMKDSEDADPTIFNADNEQLGDFKFNEDHEAVILINEGSASASEILAGAMQHAGYPVIGKPSYGKGTVQSLYTLGGGSEIKFTNSIWLTAAGDWINEEGVQPDIEVDQIGQDELLLIDPTQTYNLNDQSEDIQNINTLLNVLGYDVPDSDVYTEATQNAIEQLQADHNIEETGQLNETTAIRLMQDVRDYISENDKQLEEALNQLTQ